ncbi:hypothetical protein E2C06_35935 [Dankookia rubra]|uniref:Chitooligosaccharide deacetylase n=1 Tax=Dankookia rubra TaxID=1442381 RepID=A0A4R5Q4Q4_9PROT|nr:hypothetical protein E2C06_35935 [Dankookia rubra]
MLMKFAPPAFVSGVLRNVKGTLGLREEFQVSTCTFLTTSWDDGHPLDLRVAEMLAKYNLQGTFYVPKHAKTRTMNSGQLRALASGFEIGAHTLNHVKLTSLANPHARDEIISSKNWIEYETGTPCRMFCPPSGRFSAVHVKMARDAGFSGLRTVEMASLSYPHPLSGISIMPTSVQAHPHGIAGYFRNAVRRAAFRNFWSYISHGRSGDWTSMACSLLDSAIRNGGTFHLWGHSWELEEQEQWQRLELVLKEMGNYTSRVLCVDNFKVCSTIAAPLVMGKT